jgi:hypothetical protein
MRRALAMQHVANETPSSALKNRLEVEAPYPLLSLAQDDQEVK